MISTETTQRSGNARFNLLRKSVSELKGMLAGKSFDSLTGSEIARIRSRANVINQATHEMSAYWNVVKTHRDKAKD